MRQFNNLFSYKNNPSVLGADRLWVGIDELSRQNITDYDGV